MRDRFPMMQKLILLFMASFFCLATSLAQSYKPLKSSGEIPEEFRSLTASKVQRAQAEDRSNQRTKEERRHVNDFLLRTNYVIDEFLSSGKILFGDPVTQYINELADILLQDDPALRSKLRFYAVKSEDANAFATNQGIIFITVGLVAQVENEAQLAFVLAHEIAHFQKEHSINSVLESVKIFNETSSDRYNGNEKRIRLLSTFSKEKEFEADSLGYKRFVLAGYDKQAASTTMDVLYLSSLPYQETSFNNDFLSFGLAKYPSEFKLDSITPFPYGSDDYDDSESSHPNIRKRKTLLEAMASRSQTVAGKTNQMELEKFRNIQTIARNELIHLFLLNNQYVDAFYSAYVRLPAEPNNAFLEESIAKSLYGLAKYSSNRSMRAITRGYKKNYGEIQQAHYFFEKLSPLQLNIISVRYINDIAKKHNSSFLTRLRDDLIVDLQEREKATWETITDGIKAHENNLMKKTSEEEVKAPEAEVEEVTKDETKTTSKYEKYRVSKKEEGGAVSNSGSATKDVFHFAFLEPIMDEKFKLRFDSLAEESKADKQSYDEFQKHLKKKEKYYMRKGYSLGIDKVVFVDPFFFLVDRRKGIKLEDSEAGLMQFKKQLENSAKEAKLDADVLFAKSMSDSEVNKYNDMALMNDWMGEKLTHNSNQVSMIPLETEYTIALADAYNTDYFCYTGAFTGKEKRDFIGGFIALSIFVPYLLPVAIVRAFIPKQVTNYYYLLYNVRTGYSVWTTEKEFNLSGTGLGLTSIIYDTLNQTKKRK